MEQIWQLAPHPALRVWREGGGRHQLNAAGRLAADRLGLTDAHWQQVAQALLHDPATVAADWHYSLLARPISGQRLPLADGALLWLSLPDSSVSRLVSPSDQLELMQAAGRMGLAVRDLETGEGAWDAHLCNIMGWPEQTDAPNFEQALERVHPEDRALLRASHEAHQGQPGQYSQRFRIVRPDGQVRHLNSLYGIRPRPHGSGHVLVSVLVDDTEVVQRERQQEASRQLLAQGIALAGIIVWSVDLATQTIYFNQVGGELFRDGRAEGRRPLADVRQEIHPDDVERVQHAFDEALATGRVVDALARYRDRTGGWRYLLTRRVVQRDEQGQATGVLGVSLDLDEQIRERERSVSRLERMQLAAETIGVGFWSRDLDSGQVEWDERMYSLHHRRLEEGPPSLDEWLSRHVHADDRAMMAERQAQQYAEWTPASDIQFRVPTPDGGVRWIQSWTRRILRDGHRVAFGIHVDVTEQRLQALAIEGERERDRFAIEAAGVGLWERSLSDRPSYWSPAMYPLRGLSPDDPRPVADLVALTSHAADRAEADRLMAACMTHGQAYRHEFEVIWPDGTTRWISSIGRPVRDAQGRILAMAGINVDITEHRLAEALARERDRAAEAHAAQSEWMARVSHELRTPMNAVLGFAELMAADTLQTLPAAQAQRLEQIRTAGRQLLGLIDDLLEISRADAGQGLEPLMPVRLQDVVGDALQWVQGLARDHDVQLIWPPVLQASVMAHRRWLGQVVTNLLTNGIKYNRSGGRVRLTEAPSWLGQRPAWTLTVEDDGRGLSAEQQARLFEPFNRLGVEREGIAGTGIGLSIVERLVRAMGGSVAVRSEPGAGSAFSISLPAADPVCLPHPEAPGPTVPVWQPATGSSVRTAVAPALWRVLYVEDNPVNELLLREMMNLRQGVQLWSAADAAEGLALARQVVPELVLLDLQLPDLNGTALMHKMRAEPALAGSRYVALSANAMPQDIEAALQAGFDDYWTKPLALATFMARMDALAAQRGAATG